MSTEKTNDYTGKIKSVLFGVAVGDALGVPVEFKSRQEIKQNPVNAIGLYEIQAPDFVITQINNSVKCLYTIRKRFLRHLF